MNVLSWIWSFWRPGDFQVVPKSQNSTVGRITQLTGSNEPEPVRPIAERLKKLAKKASSRRQVKRSPRKGKRHGIDS